MAINTINYYFKIYDIVNNQQYIIQNNTIADYQINHLYVIADIFNPIVDSARIEVTAFNNKQLLQIQLAGGNVIQIFEATNNDAIGQSIFLGYISEVMVTISNNGTIIALNCNSILSQLSKQMVVNNVNETTTLLGNAKIINNIVSNYVAIGVILSFMTTQSLLSYVAQQNLINTLNAYNGVLIPFQVIDNSGSGITIDSNVWYYASTDDDRLTSLLRTINAYQLILYQDLDGSIYITQPNINNDNGGYFFEVGSNYNQEIDSESLLYKSFSYTNRAAEVANRTFASLINAVLNITNTTPESAQNTINYTSIVSSNLFKRPNQLYNTGIFEVSKHAVIDLSGAMLTDPLLLNVFSKAAQNKNLTITNTSGIKTSTNIVGLYASQLLAQELFGETSISINMARGACVANPISTSLLPIPYGKMVEVSDNGSLQFDTSQYYCYNYILEAGAQSGTTLTLNLCKPFTATANWTNV